MSFAWADLIVFSAFMAATKDQVLFSYLLYKTQYSREKIIVRILPWEGCKKKKLKKNGFVFPFLCELQQTQSCSDMQRYLRT